VKEFAVYTLSRLGLFVATYAIIVAVYMLLTGNLQIPILWPFLVAIVISSIASVYLLKGQRARFAQVVEARAQKASERLEAARSKEDDPDR
jgi:mannitol-specific phosphotransferase system IIBC component